MAGTILVTGGTGYIAGELIKQLLARGWTIHTTVRSKAKSETALMARFGQPGDRLKIFEAELMRDDGWAEANAGCSHVAHVASPILASPPKHEDDLIIPAREGTLRALRFAKAAGVKRFVQTSSNAAIAYGRDAMEFTVTESDWTDVHHPDIYPYIKSKTLAERAARDWMAENGGAMEFVSVNPAFVLGPVDNADFSASVELVKQLLDGSMPMAPDIGFSIVDVRDIAALHVKCIETPGLVNERFLGGGRAYKAIELAAILRDNLGPKARKAPKRMMPNMLVKILSLFNAGVRTILPEIGKLRHSDASHAQQRLGWQMRPIEETMVATAQSLLDKGVVKI